MVVPLLAAFAVSIVAVIWGPQAIAWFHEPPASNNLINCTPSVEWGIRSYQKLVGAASGVGFVLGLTAVTAFRLRRPKLPQIPKRS
jgi:hypothetical protein